jgi:polyhydroxyalkanoate synthesis repressor PhaR
MNDERIIKRYQNRKLYDTHQSCYVTLEEISQIVREGNEIKVIDNKTKNNITYMTQIQLLFDQERKNTEGGDTELLKRVIRSERGTFTSYIKGLEVKAGLTVEAPVQEAAAVANTEETSATENNEFGATYLNNANLNNANLNNETNQNSLN